MRQRAARNIVYARALDIFYILFGDVAAAFGERTAAYHFNCLLHIRNAHIVEHNYVGASFQSFAGTYRGFPPPPLSCGRKGAYSRSHLHCLLNAARRTDVALPLKVCRRKGYSGVTPPPTFNGVLFEYAHIGRGFARIEKARFAPFQKFYHAACVGCNAAHTLQIVERSALAR